MSELNFIARERERKHCRCKELVEKAIRSLEMNVDSKDRGANEYLLTERVAKLECPVHGRRASI